MSSCRFDDGAVFLALMGFPAGRAQYSIVESEVRPLLEHYKKSVLEMAALAGGHEDELDNFYLPTHNEDRLRDYALLGAFDHAVLCLVDGFEFAVREFGPHRWNAPGSEELGSRSFRYQLLIGPTPKFDDDDGLEALARRTFLTDSPHPLLVIARFKLNGGLVAGGGTPFVRCAVRALKLTLDALRGECGIKAEDMAALILEAFCWNEITLLLFGNAYSTMLPIIPKLRELRVSDMRTLLQASGKSGDAEALIAFGDARPLMARISDGGRCDLDGCVVFERSETTPGYDSAICREIRTNVHCQPGSVFLKIDKDDGMRFGTRWVAQAGSLSRVPGILGVDGVTCTGRGDVWAPVFGQGTSNTREFIATLVQRKLGKGIEYCLPTSMTTVGYESPPRDAAAGSSDGAGDSPLSCPACLRDKLPRLSRPFKGENMSQLAGFLRTWGVSTVLSARIKNMFSSLIEGLEDPLSFGSFEELIPFAQLVHSRIVSPELNPGRYTELMSFLDDAGSIYEKAWLNRFRAGYSMGEGTDYNLDFKGSIGQLISAFDGAYKVISRFIGTKGAFVYVSGEPGVTSTQYTLQLDHHHVLKPEVFAISAVHEAAGYYLEKCWYSQPPSFACIMSANSKAAMARRERWLQSPLGIAEDILKHSVDAYQTQVPNNVICRFLTDPRFFDYVFRDMMSFFFTYNADAQLFLYWHWNYFTTFPNYWFRPNRVGGLAPMASNVQQYRSILRTLVTLRQCDPVAFEQASFPVDSAVVVDFRAQLMDLEKQNSRLTVELAAMTDFVKRRYAAAYAPEAKAVSPLEDRLQTIRASRREDVGKFREKLQVHGEVCAFDEDPTGDSHELRAMRHVLDVLLAHLTLMREEAGTGEPLLCRGETGKPTRDADAALIQFDPRGGNFVWGTRARRNYVKYTSAVLMSLWDVAAKMKAKRLAEQLSV